MDARQKNEVMFTQIVLMFHTAAMQHLGKLKSPLTDAVERNLEAAQNTIDILDMLMEKTKGNLSDEESRLIRQVVQELKLNFVDEKNKPADPSSPAGQET